MIGKSINAKVVPVGTRCLVKVQSGFSGMVYEIIILEWSDDGNCKYQHVVAKTVMWTLKKELPILLEVLDTVSLEVVDLIIDMPKVEKPLTWSELIRRLMRG